MSLENQPSSTSTTPNTEPIGMDPLQSFFTSSEDSDWESAFMGAISNPCTPQETNSLNWMQDIETKDDDSNKTDNNGFDQINVDTLCNVSNNISDNETNEFPNIDKQIELDIKVNHAIQLPEGSVTLATFPIRDKMRETELLQTTWTPQVEPTSGCQLFLRNKPGVACMPLHLVEGREDPEKDEGFVSPRRDSPIVSNYALISPEKKQPSIEEFKPTFFDSCNILQWAIDDNNIQDPPGIENDDDKAKLKYEEHKMEIPPLNEELFTNVDYQQPSTSYMTPLPTTIHETCESSPKRARGRPPLQTPRTITPKLPKARPVSQRSDSELSYLSDSCSGLTDNDMSAMKYRRMRDLNNEASRRCRDTRKRRQAKKEEEVDELRLKNESLSRTVEKMERHIAELKRKILTDVRNPAAHIARARRRRRLQEMQSFTLMHHTENDQEEDDLPDVNAFWSA